MIYNITVKTSGRDFYAFAVFEFLPRTGEIVVVPMWRKSKENPLMDNIWCRVDDIVYQENRIEFILIPIENYFDSFEGIVDKILNYRDF